MVYLASYTDSRGRSSDVAVKMCRTDTSSEDQVSAKASIFPLIVTQRGAVKMTSASAIESP
jgi:hypothetical protein